MSIKEIGLLSLIAVLPFVTGLTAKATHITPWPWMILAALVGYGLFLIGTHKKDSK